MFLGACRSGCGYSVRCTKSNMVYPEERRLVIGRIWYGKMPNTSVNLRMIREQQMLMKANVSPSNYITAVIK